MHVLADERVNFCRRSIVRHPRMNDHRFRASLRRKIAFVADTHNLPVKSERKQNFGGRRQQRNDAHRRGMYHICKNDETQELATEREGSKSKSAPMRKLPRGSRLLRRVNWSWSAGFSRELP